MTDEQVTNLLCVLCSIAKDLHIIAEAVADVKLAYDDESSE